MGLLLGRGANVDSKDKVDLVRCICLALFLWWCWCGMYGVMGWGWVGAEWKDSA